MEYLDTYDEQGNFIGKQTRDFVHANGLWHKTVHCWLFDKEGNVYFQVRTDKDKAYTTSSGHVAAGETIKEAFGREIKEEIGLTIDYQKALFITKSVWKMDKIKEDGSKYSDRVIAEIYACEIIPNNLKFNFDLDEVKAIVKVKAKDALELFKNNITSIQGELIDENNKAINKEFKEEDFLINDHETGLGKYGEVLEFIMKFTGQ